MAGRTYIRDPTEVENESESQQEFVPHLFLLCHRPDADDLLFHDASCNVRALYKSYLDMQMLASILPKETDR